MKCWTNESLSCFKFAIDDVGSLLNHTLVAPLSVAGKDLHITSSRVCSRFRIVLKALYGQGGLLFRHRIQAVGGET